MDQQDSQQTKSIKEQMQDELPSHINSEILNGSYLPSRFSNFDPVVPANAALHSDVHKLFHLVKTKETRMDRLKYIRDMYNLSIKRETNDMDSKAKNRKEVFENMLKQLIPSYEQLTNETL